jgi:hypothetical protein
VPFKLTETHQQLLSVTRSTYARYMQDTQNSVVMYCVKGFFHSHRSSPTFLRAYLARLFLVPSLAMCFSGVKFFISTAFITILLMQMKIMIPIHTFISECYNRAMHNVFDPLLKNAAANVKTGPSVLNHVFQVTYAFCPSSFLRDICPFHLLHSWI